MRSKRFIQGAVAVSSVTLFLLVLAAFLLPLASSLSPVFSSDPFSWKNDSLLKVTLFTFAESFASVFVALLVGLPAAFFLARRSFPGKRILRASAAVPLCMPSLIVALAYISCFGVSGLYNRLLIHLFSLKEAPIRFLYSFFGIVIAQGFYNFPLVMQTVSDAWSQLDEREADSARLLGANEGRIFFTITFWQLFPSIISACVPIFLFCFFSFMIVMLFGALGTSTLETALYVSGTNLHSLKYASVIALVETTCALFVLVLYSLAEKKSMASEGLSVKNNCRSVALKKKEIFPFVIFSLVLIFFFFAPFVSILVGSFSRFTKVFSMKSLYTSLFNTFVSGMGTAVLSTLCAVVYSVFLVKSGNVKNKIFFRVIPLFPMAVSGVVLALGMLRLVKVGSPFVLVLSQSALFWPFAFRQVYASLVKVPQDVINASRLLSPSRLDSVFYVILPLCKRGILSAFGFSFALSAGDATLPLVLSLPHFDTLSLFTYRLAGSYRFNEACVGALVLALLCMGVFAFSNRVKEL